jgi:CDP-6-deoxy-D-xylo-4-hexulose-3-dehydrase
LTPGRLTTLARLSSRSNSAAVPDTAEALQRRQILRELVDAHFDDIEPLPDDECPLSVALYGADEVSAALDCMLDQQVTMGERVREFERAFADFMGSRHAIMVNSGSSANLLAMSVLASDRLPSGLRPGGLRPGDEVIVPAVTWATTIAPVLQLGCVPVLVDIDQDTLNLRPEDLAEAISPQTRAIFPVHLLGNPIDMPALMDVAAAHDLLVIEDTCESLGSTIGGRKVGSFGHFGTFSFYFSHHITTIEGGMLVTDDDELADLGRSMRAHGWTRDMSNRAELEDASPWIDPRFLFVNLGYNLRPTELQAAFGLVQLGRLEEFNEQRHSNAQYLIRELSDLSGELRFVTEQEGGRSTWFGFTVMTRDGETRRALSSFLESRKIATRPIVAGNLAVQPAFRDNPHRTVGTLVNATNVGERGLFIGNHPNLTQGQLDHIVGAFHDFFAR